MSVRFTRALRYSVYYLARTTRAPLISYHQLGASLFETGFDTFIKLEDQVVQVGDVQGLFDFQIAKLIFEL